MNDPRPPSPCINVCALDATQTCIGCGRTIDEIARWGRMSAAEQWQVVGRLASVRPANDSKRATDVAKDRDRA
jgi:predicted Fe-S protein YdhL (DUF1289 family)